MKIEIELTEQQEKFLKEFASKQYPGAKDNLCTSMPIHVVQSRDDIYFEADSEYGDDTVFVDDDREFETAEEVLELYYEDEEPPIPIVPYEFGMNLTDKEGKERFITSPEAYFEVYEMGWDDIRYVTRVKRYKDVAFFFILDEAKRYMEYQGHNLNNPRTFTYSPGYSNYGDYEHFWMLLMNMGKQLNEMSQTK